MTVYVYLVLTPGGSMPRITTDREFAESTPGRISPVVTVYVPRAVKKVG